MQHYIEQLIGDLRRATWNVRPPNVLWSESEADPTPAEADVYRKECAPAGCDPGRGRM